MWKGAHKFGEEETRPNKLTDASREWLGVNCLFILGDPSFIYFLYHVKWTQGYFQDKYLQKTSASICTKSIRALCATKIYGFYIISAFCATKHYGFYALVSAHKRTKL